jgi:hypothetical protein
MIGNHWLWTTLLVGQLGGIPDSPSLPAPYNPAQPVQAPASLGDYVPTTPAFPAAAAPNFPQVASPAPGPGTTFTGVEMVYPFRSDHDFDGFTGPLSNPVQFKDPRSLTEARFLFMNNWARPGGVPVLGTGSFQVYALQLRLALSERLQLYADKDGIVRLSPNPGKSVTGLANLMAGLKYVWIRDVENQFLFSTAIQYEVPTGYANIFQNQGAGLLGMYAILGKEFGDNWHLILQAGQNLAMDDVLTGYFMTSAHIDRRFGRFTPFYEANWFYYNQPGNFLPASVGIEGGGWLSLGTAGTAGLNYLTNAVGFKYDVTDFAELGVGYEFQLSNRDMLLGNMLHAQLIIRY